MKKIAFLLLLTFPLAIFAQVDDIYFVPKKEKKVLVVEGAEDAYFVDADELAGGDADVVVDGHEYDTYIENMYYTNDVDDVYDDYGYSSRIIRFRSPGRLLSSNLYWDLTYNCGINDWLVYDNGYSIDIYPTSINPFYWSDFRYGWSAYNYWNWNSWYRPHYWYDHYWNTHWGCAWYGNHYYGGWHDHYHASWKPSGRRPYSITTNGIAGGRNDRFGNRYTNGRGVRSDRKERPGVVAGRRDGDRPGADKGVRRERNGRGNEIKVGAGNGVRDGKDRKDGRRGSGNGATVRKDDRRGNGNDATVRKDGRRGNGNDATVRKDGRRGNGNDATIRKDGRRGNGNDATVRKDGRRGNSGTRVGGSSSRGYDRPSSTSVRGSSDRGSRSSGGGSSLSGGSRSGSSGSGSRISSGSRSGSSGSGSRAGSSGGGSRGGGSSRSGGGSRGGGRGR